MSLTLGNAKAESSDRAADARPLPSGVITFLLTDVVGSTRLWENAPGVMPSTLDRHDQLIELAVSANNGVLLKAKGEGDSTFSVFGRASDGVAAARDAQIALQREPWPLDTPISVRMSVHTGEAVERHRDYFGQTVNRAARLRAIAEAAQVLISQATADLVTDSMPDGCALVDLGVQTLRDLARPELIFQLELADAPSMASRLVAAVTKPPPTMSDGFAAPTSLTSLTSPTSPTRPIPPSPGAPHAVVSVSARGETGAAMTPEPTVEPSGSVPVPRRLDAVRNERFAGRSAERQRLRRCYDAVTAGACRAALLAGPPGIGKTGLATAAALAANDDGATVLLGRCDEDILVPYQPWIESLNHLVAHVPGSVLKAVGSRKLTELGGLVPEVHERQPGLARRVATDPETDRYLLFTAVSALLSEASALTPITLMIDDLHWADKPTLVLLRHVLQSATPMRVQVIATYRDAEADSSAHLLEFLAALRREPVVDWITLSGLDDVDIVDMIEREVGHTLDADGIKLARVLRRDTDGNPFFASEMLRHLVESGFLVRRDGEGWVTPEALQMVGLPQSVRDVISQRVARLGAPAQQVLRLASVIGREFDLELLSAVSGRTDLELLDVLERGQAGTVLAEVNGSVGRYSFLHALIEQTLYEELGAARRQLVHRQIAEFLEHLRDAGADIRIAELAQHWMAGGRAGDTMKMISYAIAAGDAAAAALAPGEAARWYGDALRLVDQERDPDPAMRTDLLIALGTTQLQGGERPLLEAARLAVQNDDDERLIRAMLAGTRGWRSRVAEVDAERLLLIEAALGAVGEHDSARRARLLKVYATDLSYAGDNARCRRVYEEAVEMARRVGDAETLRDVLIRQFTGFWGPDSTEYRLDRSSEAVVLADRSGDRGASFWAWTDLSYVAMASADRATFDRAAARIDELGEELGPQPELDWVISAMASARELHAGRLAEAETLARRSYEQAVKAGQRHAEPHLAVQLGAVLYQRGDEREVLPLHRAVIERAPHLDCNRALLARAHLGLGDRARALELLEADVAAGFAFSIDVYWLIASCHWAEIAARLGHREAARTLYDRLLPWHGQIALMWATFGPSVSHYLGMLAAALGDPVGAAGHFDEAHRLHESIAAPFSVTWTELEWAKVLCAEGPDRDLARASELSSRAMDTADRLGFGGLRDEAAQVIRTARTMGDI